MLFHCCNKRIFAKLLLVDIFAYLHHNQNSTIVNQPISTINSLHSPATRALATYWDCSSDRQRARVALDVPVRGSWRHRGTVQRTRLNTRRSRARLERHVAGLGLDVGLSVRLGHTPRAAETARAECHAEFLAAARCPPLAAIRIPGRSWNWETRDLCRLIDRCIFPTYI